MASIFLDCIRPESPTDRSLYIEDPELIVEAFNEPELSALLRRIEEMTAEGYYAAGFFSYEAGYAILPRMGSFNADFPLAWFCFTKNPAIFSAGDLPSAQKSTTDVAISGGSVDLSLEEYEAKISQIKTHLAQGDTYQVNFTLRYAGEFHQDPWTVYLTLREQQRVPYGAFIETAEWAILSLSPEIFFRRKDRRMMMRPMKGTARRGRYPEEDRRLAESLSQNIKERSENLMIVDLLRNDLGKICEAGSVAVTRIMDVERYQTVLQMTSTIEGELTQGIGSAEIIRALFPSGSVTGAPKISTMQIIRKLETSARKVYTGSIGYFARNEALFNVAIRTVLIDKIGQQYEMGIGSGILHEANPAQEYQECLLKGSFLTTRAPEFILFETMLWTPETGFRLQDYHRRRLSSSAEYFLFPFSNDDFTKILQDVEKIMATENQPFRVKLTLDRNGKISAAHKRIEPLAAGPTICLSKVRRDSSQKWLFHKTSHRDVYETELKEAQQSGHFDVIFRNEKEEITEGARSNIYLEKDGILFTPPVDCGLLAGVYRSQLLDTQKPPVQEKILYEEDLRRADALFVSNALRGLLRVTLS